MNRFDILSKCLNSIPAAFGEITYEVIIVDNGSVREDADEFYYELAHDKRITVIRGKTNVGFPVACNFGAKRTRSPILFFLNSDVILDEHSGELLVDALNNRLVGVVGMKLVFPDDLLDLDPKIRPSGKIQHVGISLDIHGNSHHPFIGWDEYHDRVMSQRNVFAVTGAALMVRRDVWNKVGGFYEGYGLGTFEDVDLCATARSLGYAIEVVPKARGQHYTGATAESSKIGYPLKQNQLTFMQRHAKHLIWWDGIVL